MTKLTNADLVRITPPFFSRAACIGKDPEIFHPLPGERDDKAKAICNRCPVRDECLEFAIEHRERGVWGGTSARERRNLTKAAKLRLL